MDCARDEVAELAELAHRLRHARAQSIHMGAALDGGDQVDVALADRAVRIRRPAQRVVDRVVVIRARAGDGLGGDALVLVELLDEIGSQIPGVEPLVLLDKRSEEHTSELQSHSDLVCRLLLEKKKKSRDDAQTSTETHT